ncbi:MAG: SCO family protein [Rickettsiales bacterium]
MDNRCVKRAFFTSVALFALIGALTAAIVLKKHDKPINDLAQISTSAPSIGGDYTLTNQYNEPVTQATYKGKYELVFFGFTHCPDICPTTLSAITQALNSMGDKAAEFVPVLITVDPDRDTPAVMADYAKAFHPSLQALTGPKEEIARVSKEYGVYAAKEEAPEPEEHQEASNDHSMHSDAGHDSSYMVNHTGLVYLMDRNGKYLDHFSQDTTPQQFAEKLNSVLAAE